MSKVNLSTAKHKPQPAKAGASFKTGKSYSVPSKKKNSNRVK